jgi:hypothetical protein
MQDIFNDILNDSINGDKKNEFNGYIGEQNNNSVGWELDDIINPPTMTDDALANVKINNNMEIENKSQVKNNAKKQVSNKKVSIKKHGDKQSSFNDKIKVSKEKDEIYANVINSFGIVSWQMMNKIESSPPTTIKSRLQRLVKKELIKKCKHGYYHSTDYKCSQNDRHNLWLSSMMITAHIDDYDYYSDTEILKKKMNEYRFSRAIYKDDFIPDLIIIDDDYIEAYEIELHPKSKTKTVNNQSVTNEVVKNKIEAYKQCIIAGQFNKVYYYTDNNSVIKQVKHWINYFNCDDKIEIISSTDEELMIK